MCIVVVDHEPTALFPLLVLSVRDEVLDRPWSAPARHWSGDIVGGLDLRAGGTWLCLDVTTRRVGCVLNGLGETAAPRGRRSRGELPLRTVTGVDLPTGLARYDPFHLLTIDLTGALLVSWDGSDPRETKLKPGVSVVVNSGVDRSDPRAARLLDRLARLPRPEPGARDGTAVARAPRVALVGGGGGFRDETAAPLMRRTGPDGVRYGSNGVTFIGLSWTDVRYDFGRVPDRPGPLPGLTRVV